MAFKIGNWEPAKTFQELIQDPMRAARAVSTGGVSEAPRAIGKQGWEQTLQVGPPGGKTPTIADITNPYAEAAKMATGEISGMLPQYKQLYGTGAGALTGLIGDLQAQARGQAGPGMSLGQALLQQGLTQNIGAVQSQLASQRGLSPALRARMAAQQTAALQGQTAQQAGILGLQQQLAAQQQLGQLGTGAAQLGSEAQLRGAGLLTGAAGDIEKIRANIAAANQAAAAADKARTVGAATAVLKGAGDIFASGALPLNEQSTGTTNYAGPSTYGAGGSNQYRAYAAHGGRIDGVAPYAGDTPKNDVVPANLSPGEIVIPRTAAGSKKDAKKFIDALDDWDEEPSYGKVLKARQKKNYADGGMIPNDEQMLQEAGQAYLEKQRAPYPMVEKAKGAFDEFLASRVVEPLAQRGDPTLGAALATVPSTAMEALVPSTPDELMQTVIPMPGLKGKSLQKAKKAQALDLLEQLSADDVDISKLPSMAEYKKLAKNLKTEKLTKETEKLSALRTAKKKTAKESAYLAAKKIFDNPQNMGFPSAVILDEVAMMNLDNPQIKNAYEKYQILAREVPHLNQEIFNLGAQKKLSAYQDARKNLFDTLQENKDTLKFDTELEQIKKVRKLPTKK